MSERQSDLRAIRRTEARRNAFVRPFASAFNRAITKQIDALQPYYGFIATGTNPTEVVINAIVEDDIHDVYYRLYSTVGAKSSQFTREDLQGSKSFEHRSMRHKSDPQSDADLMAVLISSQDTPENVIRAVQAYLQNVGGQRITTITNTTRKIALGLIQDILAQGVEQGWSVDRIGRELSRQVPQGMRQYNFRGGMIARTEVLNAYNLAEMEQVKDLDIQILKYWMARLDGRERITHADAYLTYRDEPINKFDSFIVGNRFMERPGDPNGGAAEVINCRCVLGYKRR